MSEQELRRAPVLEQVKTGAWTIVEAAERMELSNSKVAFMNGWKDADHAAA